MSTYLVSFHLLENSSLPNQAFLPGVKTALDPLELYPAFLAPVGTGFLSLVSCWTCLWARDADWILVSNSSIWKWTAVKMSSVQVDALLNDFFLLFEDLKLLWVVSAWHLGAVAADARRGRGVQRVNAPIAVDGFWSLGVSVLLFWWFLLAWRVIIYNKYDLKN